MSTKKNPFKPPFELGPHPAHRGRRALVHWRTAEGDSFADVANGPFTLDVRRLIPCRTDFARRPDQEHTPGFTYSTLSSGMIEYESWLEARWIHAVEGDRSVRALVAQPLMFDVSDNARGSWWHVPDILVLDDQQSITVYDVKNPKMVQDEKVVKQADRTAQLCAELGWEFRLVSTLPELEEINLQWLRAYRRRPYLGARDAALTAAVLTQAARPQTIGALVAAVDDDPVLVRPLLFHLVWTHELEVDMTQPLRETTIVRKAAR